MWLGARDEYVKDTEEPECWVGVIEPKPTDPELPLSEVADNIWKCIRVEKDAEKESDGWIYGRFRPNS